MSATLRRTIESEVIPRLMLLNLAELRGMPAALDAPGPTLAIDPPAVEAFAQLLASATHNDAVARLRLFLAQGVSSDRLLLDLLAPAARLLGEWWASDTVSFTAVSSGLARLHNLLHLIARPPANDDAGEVAGSILLAAAPGERHLFGLAVVEEFFREAGWSVTSLPGAGEAAIVDAVRSRAYDCIGLSLSREDLQTSLRSLIEAVRRESLNRGVQVLVGGPAFAHDPGLCAAVGADATARDGRQAVVEARSLLRLSAVAR